MRVILPGQIHIEARYIRAEHEHRFAEMNKRISNIAVMVTNGAHEDN